MFFMNNPHEHHQHRSSHHSIGQAMQLVGRNVKINRAGPDSVSGRLLAVNGEVLVLSSMGAITYVNGRHVKSITEGVSGGASGGHGHGRSGQAPGKSGMTPPFITSSSIIGVLSQLRQQIVQINSGGPERLEGLLADVNHEFVLLIVGREQVLVPIFHIRSVSTSGRSGGHKSHSGGKQSSGSHHKKSDGKHKRDRS